MISLAASFSSARLPVVIVFDEQMLAGGLWWASSPGGPRASHWWATGRVKLRVGSDWLGLDRKKNYIPFLAINMPFIERMLAAGYT